jgi:hypothetical protein
MVQQPDYDVVDEKFEAILRAIIQALEGRQGKDKVSLALYFLLAREANTWRSIRLFLKHVPLQFHGAFMVDIGTLLRAMFDAYLQADYIFRDPAKRSQLAAQYLDFAHIEQYQMPRKVLRHDNSIANALKESPMKSDGEKRLQAEYDRVKDQFLIDEKKGPRDKWYKGNLRQLAEAAGKVAEYDTFMASFSGCVHSSAFAVGRGPMIPQEYVLSLASAFAARVAKMNVEYDQFDLGGDQTVLDEFCKSWLDHG